MIIRRDNDVHISIIIIILVIVFTYLFNKIANPFASNYIKYGSKLTKYFDDSFYNVHILKKMINVNSAR